MEKNTDRRKPILRIINIVIVSCLGAYLVYFLLSQISLADLKKSFFEAYVPSLVIGLALMFSMDFFKSYRQIILIGTGDIRFIDMFFTSQIRNAFNMLLPARTGELSYIYVLRKKFKIPVEIGVSTLVVGLIFELILVFCIAVISIIIIGINGPLTSSISVIVISSLLLIASLLLLIFLSQFIDLFIKIFNFLINKFPGLGKNKVFSYLFDKLIETNKSVQIIQKRKIYWKVFLLTVATRAIKFTSYYFLIHAYLKPLGYDFASLPYWTVILATIASELSAVLPTHAVAGLGTYEGAFVLAFVSLGFPEKPAIIAGFNYHIINLIFTTIWGIIAILIISMPFYKIKKKLPDLPES
jgi:hypothetical protein